MSKGRNRSWIGSLSDSLFSSALPFGSGLSTMQERGGSLTFADNVVTLAFNANVGFITKGTGDAIRTITYSSSSLAQIYLQPKMHPELRSTLSQLLNNVLMFGQILCTAP